MMGINKKIITQNNFTQGIITDVYSCWWFTINTKPVRSHSLDGAVFPDIITFEYNVGDNSYSGKKFIGINRSGLKKWDRISVYYDKSKPKRWALKI